MLLGTNSFFQNCNGNDEDGTSLVPTSKLVKTDYMIVNSRIRNSEFGGQYGIRGTVYLIRGTVYLTKSGNSTISKLSPELLLSKLSPEQLVSCPPNSPRTPNMSTNLVSPEHSRVICPFEHGYFTDGKSVLPFPAGEGRRKLLASRPAFRVKSPLITQNVLRPEKKLKHSSTGRSNPRRLKRRYTQ